MVKPLSSVCFAIVVLTITLSGGARSQSPSDQAIWKCLKNFPLSKLALNFNQYYSYCMIHEQLLVPPAETTKPTPVLTTTQAPAVTQAARNVSAPVNTTQVLTTATTTAPITNGTSSVRNSTIQLIKSTSSIISTIIGNLTLLSNSTAAKNSTAGTNFTVLHNTLTTSIPRNVTQMTHTLVNTTTTNVTVPAVSPTPLVNATTLPVNVTTLPAQNVTVAVLNLNGTKVELPSNATLVSIIRTQNDTIIATNTSAVPVISVRNVAPHVTVMPIANTSVVVISLKNQTLTNWNGTFSVIPLQTVTHPKNVTSVNLNETLVNSTTTTTTSPTTTKLVPLVVAPSSTTTTATTTVTTTAKPTTPTAVTYRTPKPWVPYQRFGFRRSWEDVFV